MQINGQERPNNPSLTPASHVGQIIRTNAGCLVPDTEVKACYLSIDANLDNGINDPASCVGNRSHKQKQWHAYIRERIARCVPFHLGTAYVRLQPRLQRLNRRNARCGHHAKQSETTMGIYFSSQSRLKIFAPSDAYNYFAPATSALDQAQAAAVPHTDGKCYVLLNFHHIQLSPKRASA